MVYTESELIIPALQEMKDKGGTISTTELIKELERKLKPDGKDKEIIKGRKDTHFSQKVRNLKSHDTLTKRGIAEYDGGNWKITNKGLIYLEENKEVVDSLKNQGFTKKEINKQIEKDFKDLIIEEGALQKISTTQRKRSDKLRKEAIKHFKSTLTGLKCEVCGFDFYKFYNDLGNDFIEIHHKEPLSESEIEGTKSKLSEALKKVSPLCSNCHRMIHRFKDKMLSVEELKNIIKEQKV